MSNLKPKQKIEKKVEDVFFLRPFVVSSEESIFVAKVLKIRIEFETNGADDLGRQLLADPEPREEGCD